jgi:hypothetical protein
LKNEEERSQKREPEGKQTEQTDVISRTKKKHKREKRRINGKNIHFLTPI